MNNYLNIAVTSRQATNKGEDFGTLGTSFANLNSGVLRYTRAFCKPLPGEIVAASSLRSAVQEPLHAPITREQLDRNFNTSGFAFSNPGCEIDELIAAARKRLSNKQIQELDKSEQNQIATKLKAVLKGIISLSAEVSDPGARSSLKRQARSITDTVFLIEGHFPLSLLKPSRNSDSAAPKTCNSKLHKLELAISAAFKSQDLSQTLPPIIDQIEAIIRDAKEMRSAPLPREQINRHFNTSGIRFSNPGSEIRELIAAASRGLSNDQITELDKSEQDQIAIKLREVLSGIRSLSSEVSEPGARSSLKRQARSISDTVFQITGCFPPSLLQKPKKSDSMLTELSRLLGTICQNLTSRHMQGIQNRQLGLVAKEYLAASGKLELVTFIVGSVAKEYRDVNGELDLVTHDNTDVADEFAKYRQKVTGEVIKSLASSENEA